MKTMKIICLSLLLCLAQALTAQTNSLFDRYCDHQNVTSVYISKAMMEMNPKLFVEDPVIGKVAKNLSLVKILSTSHGTIGRAIRKDFAVLVKQTKYELLMKQKQDNNLSEFYIVRKGNKVGELLMLVVKGDTTKYVVLMGDLSLKEIQGIIQSEQACWDKRSQQIENLDLRLFDNLQRHVASAYGLQKQGNSLQSEARNRYEEGMKRYEEGMKKLEEGMKRYEQTMQQYQKRVERAQKKMEEYNANVYRIE